MTPIPWPTLTAEEKAKTFFDAMGVKPVSVTFSLKNSDGEIDGPFASEESALRCARKYYEVFDARCLIRNPVYPPLTLDALFALAKERKIDFRIEAYERGYGVFIGANDEWEFDAIDALSLALLRHAGFEVLTEQSTEGKTTNMKEMK